MSSKLRDAVSRLVREIEDGMLIELSGKFESDLAKSLLADVKTALATPRRNCDVGTVEEQMKRQHDTMCNTTKACPDSDWSCRKCFAEWSQLPYKEGGAE